MASISAAPYSAVPTEAIAKQLPSLAVDLAAFLLESALKVQTHGEKQQSDRMARLMEDPAGKAFTFAMADQVFRAPSPERKAERLRDLISDYGVPGYLPLPSRLALRIGGMASAIAPAAVMPLVQRELRTESASVILPAEDAPLHRHLDARQAAGMRMNLNQLGEAVLGEEEAANRLRANLARLADPAIDYISIKISSIFSQIHPVADSETLDEIKCRLREIYRAAMAGPRPKFVNLDMEEYRDLHLTCSAFRDVLMEPEFMKLETGIVLQAYLPDAWPVQRQLIDWTKQRILNGGAGIKIRIVKGANLAMEKVESEMHDWPLAPYDCKVDVDANFKRMLIEGCQPDNARSVRLGVASHNLFDIAYGLLLREMHHVEDRVDFEMLEGMANHQARAVRDHAQGLLLYAPVVRKEDFPSAIAYLVRRLDENTSPENFLHDLFGMTPGDERWNRQKQRFLDACARIHTVSHGPNRIQDRANEHHAALSLELPFHNAADTDWSLAPNVRWIRSLVERMKAAPVPQVPLQIGGAFVAEGTIADSSDPSDPGRLSCRYTLADTDQIQQALEIAVAARDAWNARGFAGRASLIAEVARVIAARRGEAIAVMVGDAGKAVMEGDVEVSEAIDFASYYARAFTSGWFDGSSFTPLGTVLVTPPWNFPFAIPCGGILAALAAGNTVILKPAPETVLTAWVMINMLWDAGIPREVLQFVPCPDDETGRALVTDPRIAAVILTGAYETARMFQKWKPDLRLFAETSGKNALIITAAADPDLAVKDLVKSAFGHAGQKCSAASLGIIEAELYDDPSFREKLRDAASSLAVGGSWDYRSIVTPIIRAPGDELARALTSLEEGEEWLLEPRMVDGNPCLWSPGIKLGISPAGWYRRTECFGPVLGLIRARDLDDAIRLQNDSAFGLTGGIHTLDPAEILEWKDRVQVGNGYINRPITGAIVRRQPFGGWKHSCFGPGSKAGGPNYAAQFGTWSNNGVPTRAAAPSPQVVAFVSALAFHDLATMELKAASHSDAWWIREEFSQEHDPSALSCESNVFRYRPFGKVLVRATETTAARLLLAAVASGAEVELSLPPGSVFPAWNGVTWHEDDSRLADRLRNAGYEMIRAIQPTDSFLQSAAALGIRLVSHEPVLNGRIEMLPYYREQSITETLHRHGAVLARPEQLP